MKSAHELMISCISCFRTFKYEGSFRKHHCLKCESCGRIFYQSKKVVSHICIQTIKCLVCHRYMPILTNTHLAKHGLTPETYSTKYQGETVSDEIKKLHFTTITQNNPNTMPGVKEKQIANNAMNNPIHLITHKLAVNDPKGQLQRYLSRKKRANQSRYTGSAERWLADFMKVPINNRRIWVTGAGEVDIAFPDAKVAIEVQGCYWHGCLKCGHEQPGNKGQRERDLKKSRTLLALGWTLFAIWEHEIEPFRKALGI